MSHQYERERLNRRVASIRGTETARLLRRYRNNLMKRSSVTADQPVGATSVAGERKTYWHRDDEVKLCHEFLDTHQVDQML